MVLKCLKLICERGIRLRMVNVICVTRQFCLSEVVACSALRLVLNLLLCVHLKSAVAKYLPSLK